jgi:hypothetical protein
MRDIHAIKSDNVQSVFRGIGRGEAVDIYNILHAVANNNVTAVTKAKARRLQKDLADKAGFNSTYDPQKAAGYRHTPLAVTG